MFNCMINSNSISCNMPRPGFPTKTGITIHMEGLIQFLALLWVICFYMLPIVLVVLMGVCIYRQCVQKNKTTVLPTTYVHQSPHMAQQH